MRKLIPLFLTIFLVFVACGGNSPSDPPPDPCASGHNWNWVTATCTRSGCPATPAAGLYRHPLTNASTPIAGVTTLAEAITYVTADVADRDGVQFVFLVGANADFAGTTITRANRHLTLIGLAAERTITMTGAENARLFDLNATGSSLTLGNNITLQGRVGGSTTTLVLVNNGTFLMLEGSKITGHTTTSVNGAIWINGANAGFIMKGGSITGNTTTHSNTGAIGGLVVQSTNNINLEGGSITGNTGPAGDISVGRNQILNLSGTAIVGTLTLGAISTTERGIVSIAQGWSGQVTSLNLLGNNSNMETNIGFYIDKTVLQGAGVYNLVAADLAKFPLGNFIGNAAADTQPISPTHHIVLESGNGVVRAKL